MNTKKEDSRIIGEVIREHRKRLRLSQERLAEKIQRESITVSRWERGTQGMTVASLTNLARALHMKPSDVLANL